MPRTSAAAGYSPMARNSIPGRGDRYTTMQSAPLAANIDYHIVVKKIGPSTGMSANPGIGKSGKRGQYHKWSTNHGAHARTKQRQGQAVTT